MHPLYLLKPRLTGLVNTVKRPDGKASFKAAVMAVLGLTFWVTEFYLIYRTLVYFRSTELIGDLLAYKLLELVFLTFFSILLFSNVITALSTLYLSDEMTLIMSSPASRKHVYFYKYVETVTVSSWMVAVFGLPVIIAYGAVYGAGALFYPAGFVTLIGFILIPGPLGIAVTVVLVRVFPAKRAKDVLMFLSVILVILLFFVIRFTRPERILDPESFGEVADYVASLAAPSNQYLPSLWASKTLWPLVSGGVLEPIWPLLIFSTALAMFFISYWIFDALYATGYSRSLEGGRFRTFGMAPTGSLIDCLAGKTGTPVKALVLKDVKTFFRDTTQWSQLFLLGALVVIYLYNFTALPIDRFPFATFFLENFISFLNLGLAGFVLAAVSVRFVFPAVSLEGEAIWILRTSPLGLKGFIWAKFWSAWVPLFVLAEVLVYVSNVLLNASVFMSVLSAAAVFVMTFGITGLGVGMGSMHPRFRYENAAQISSGYGGVIYMITAMGFIGAVVVLLAWPTYVFLSAQYRGGTVDALGWTFSVVCICAAVILNIAACIIPMRMGLASLKQLEG